MLHETKNFNLNENSNEGFTRMEESYWNESNSFQMSCIPMRVGKGKRFNKNKIFEESDNFFEQTCDRFQN